MFQEYDDFVNHECIMYKISENIKITCDNCIRKNISVTNHNILNECHCTVRNVITNIICQKCENIKEEIRNIEYQIKTLFDKTSDTVIDYLDYNKGQFITVIDLHINKIKYLKNILYKKMSVNDNDYILK